MRTLYLMQVVAAEEGPREVVGMSGESGEPRPSRRPRATSIDELEAEFQRKKRRELEQAHLAGAGDYQPVQQVVRSGAKVGRNDPCPCGSGKKYKKCCGAAA